MLKLQEFKNKHNSDDIYVIASGKSADYIDPSFFNDKITIGVNQVYKRFKTTYLVRKEAKILETVVKENHTTTHFVSIGHCGGIGNKLNLQIVNNKKLYKIAPICCFQHNKNTNTGPVVLPKEGQLVCTFSTITTAIHLAAYMGAANIILLGHDCGSLDGQANFKGYHTKKTMMQPNVNGYKNWLKQIENQTLELKKILKKKHGCNIYSLNPFINFGLEGHKYTR